MNHYYIYAYLDPTIEYDWEYKYKPFYIGKGKGQRLFHHLNEVLQDKPVNYNKIKRSYIKKLLDNDLKPIILKIKENLTEKNANLIEIELINKFKKIIDGGILTNIADGGEGVSLYGENNPMHGKIGDLNPFYNKSHTNKTKEIISLKSKMWWNSLSDIEKKLINEKRSKSIKQKWRHGDIKNYWDNLDEAEKQLLIEERYKNRYGISYEEKLINDNEKIIRIKKYHELAEYNKRKKRVLKEWRHRHPISMAGENNPMFKQGHKVAAEKNGRAKKYEVVIDYNIFHLNGNMKTFVKDFKTYFNSRDIIRSTSYKEKHNIVITEIDSISNKYLYKGVDDFKHMDKEKYDKNNKN